MSPMPPSATPARQRSPSPSDSPTCRRSPRGSPPRRRFSRWGCARRLGHQRPRRDRGGDRAAVRRRSRVRDDRRSRIRPRVDRAMVAVPRRHAGDPRDALSRRSVVTVSDAAEALERYPMLATLGPEYPGRPGRRAAARRGDDPRGDRINFDRARRFTPRTRRSCSRSGVSVVRRSNGRACSRPSAAVGSERPASRARLRARRRVDAGEIADIASDRVYPLLGGRTGIVGAVSMDGEAIELVSEEGFGSGGRSRSSGSRSPPDDPRPRWSGRTVRCSSVRPRRCGRATPTSGSPRAETARGRGSPRASGRTIGVLSVSYAKRRRSRTGRRGAGDRRGSARTRARALDAPAVER